MSEALEMTLDAPLAMVERESVRERAKTHQVQDPPESIEIPFEHALIIGLNVWQGGIG